MTGNDTQALKALLGRVRALLARPGNGFEWSGWDDATEALAEFDDLVTATLEKSDLKARRTLKIYFAATGPIQEVSLSSGWGDEFLALANSIDEIL